MLLNTGTNNRLNTPVMRMNLLRRGPTPAGSSASNVLSSTGAASSLRIYRMAIAVGMTTETIHGTKSVPISAAEVTLPRIHSMIVVTSPIGDQAPPLLAAMTIRLA